MSDILLEWDDQVLSRTGLENVRQHEHSEISNTVMNLYVKPGARPTSSDWAGHRPGCCTTSTR